MGGSRKEGKEKRERVGEKECERECVCMRERDTE